MLQGPAVRTPDMRYNKINVDDESYNCVRSVQVVKLVRDSILLYLCSRRDSWLAMLHNILNTKIMLYRTAISSKP